VRLRYVPMVISLMAMCLISHASSDQYVIQQGDTIFVTVLGEPDLTKRLVVDKAGNINLPLIKEVSVAGMTLSDAAEQIAKQLRSVMRYPQVTVELVELAKLQITVSGEVRNPGIYQLPNGARVMEAVTAAGGYQPTADLTKVRIAHSASQEPTVTIDLTRFLISGDLSANVTLASGDTVFIPATMSTVSGSVMVLGAVRQSGARPLTPGMTVRDAILIAGGPTELADLSSISLRHTSSTESLMLDYSQLMQGVASANPLLQAGDVIYVGVKEQLGSYTIYGAVANPGKYELKGKTAITEAIAIAGGARDRAKLGEIRIMRATAGGPPETISVNVGKIMGGEAENIQVRDGDNIYVPPGKDKIDIFRVASLLVSIGWLLMRD